MFGVIDAYYLRMYEEVQMTCQKLCKQGRECHNCCHSILIPLKNLPLAIESEDVDVFWNRWSTSFLSVMRCIPPKSVHLNRPIPWIDSDIRHDIRLRERLYKRFKSSKCMSNIRSSATKWSPSSERPNRSFFRT